MLVKNSPINTSCLACLNSRGEKKVVDVFMENGNVVILIRCQGCGGVTKNVYKPQSQEYVSGPRKPLDVSGK